MIRARTNYNPACRGSECHVCGACHFGNCPYCYADLEYGPEPETGEEVLCPECFCISKVDGSGFGKLQRLEMEEE
jgi:hypothetical protein